MNIKQLNDNELVKEYKIAKMNFINAEEFSEDEKEAEKMYDELWQEIQRRNIDLRDYIETTGQRELLKSLINYINDFQETMKIDLISFIEDEGYQASNGLLGYLWDGIKELNIKRANSINNIAISIIAYK